jgi:hypothetical protein
MYSDHGRDIAVGLFKIEELSLEQLRGKMARLPGGSFVRIRQGDFGDDELRRLSLPCLFSRYPR